MCDCRTRIEAELLKKCQERFPASTGHGASLTGFGVAVTPGLGLIESAYMNAELTHTVVTKSSGLAREKRLSVAMHFSHCPFCGVPYPTTGD